MAITSAISQFRNIVPTPIRLRPCRELSSI
jgi:hypothetical protein